MQRSLGAGDSSARRHRDTRPRSKTLAVWLAALFGSLNIHATTCAACSTGSAGCAVKRRWAGGVWVPVQLYELGQSKLSC
jgi:hypothetical protein